uniref:Syntaxin-8 n=1 Tax=Sphaerodactylus townsendi TaxID=933632 RepID=A0ACB8EKJ9_9SAUR
MLRLSMYDSTYLIAQEIAEKIQERNRCQRNGESTTKLNAVIRSLLPSLKEKTDHLKELLFRSVSTRQITQHEGDRRQNLLDDLLTRHGRLQASFRNDDTEPEVIRGSFSLMFPASMECSVVALPSLCTITWRCTFCFNLPCCLLPVAIIASELRQLWACCTGQG